jgi:hypothetical protein
MVVFFFGMYVRQKKNFVKVLSTVWTVSLDSFFEGLIIVLCSFSDMARGYYSRRVLWL